MIVGEDGREVIGANYDGPCPGCGAGKDRRETFNAFGGSWRKLCQLCGYQFGAGSGAPPQENQS